MNSSFSGAACPLEAGVDEERISLAHGEGARASRRLLTEFILPRLRGARTSMLPSSSGGSESAPDVQIRDAAELITHHAQLAFCTDSHTITPLFFPGGDLGTLSVYGTVNDLAVAGAVPIWLSLSLILEEGLPLSVLGRILDSCATAAAECGVQIVTGDTKVVPRGAVDAIFLNTSGIGEFQSPPLPGPFVINPGDQILVSGDVGRHGTAVLSERNGLQWAADFGSDCGSVYPAVEALRRAVPGGIRCMRDATRGGVSAVLHEWAMECGQTLNIHESRVPICEAVRGACELFGIDPLYLANEGTFLAVVQADVAAAALAALRDCPQSRQAACIGEVQPRGISPVTVTRSYGRARPLDEPTGAPLPRIC